MRGAVRGTGYFFPIRKRKYQGPVMFPSEATKALDGFKVLSHLYSWSIVHPLWFLHILSIFPEGLCDKNTTFLALVVYLDCNNISLSKDNIRKMLPLWAKNIDKRASQLGGSIFNVLEITSYNLFMVGFDKNVNTNNIDGTPITRTEIKHR